MNALLRLGGVAVLLAAPASAYSQWSTGSLPDYQRFEYAAAATDTRLYVAGGHDGTLMNRVDILDVPSGQWTTAGLSLGRYGLGAVAHGGKVFFGGGHVAMWTVSDRVDIYDEASGVWSQSRLPVPAGFSPGAGAAGGKVVFAGGTGTGIAQIHDIATGQWTVEPLQGPLGYVPTAYNDRWICFVGGDLNYTGLKSLAVYDSVSDTWRHMAVDHRFTGAALVGDRLFAHVCPPTPSTLVVVLDLVPGQ